MLSECEELMDSASDYSSLPEARRVPIIACTASAMDELMGSHIRHTTDFKEGYVPLGAHNPCSRSCHCDGVRWLHRQWASSPGSTSVHPVSVQGKALVEALPAGLFKVTCPPRTRCVCTRVWENSTVAMAALMAGADDVVPKPVQLAAMVKVLDRYVPGWRSRVACSPAALAAAVATPPRRSHPPTPQCSPAVCGSPVSASGACSPTGPRSFTSSWAAVGAKA